MLHHQMNNISTHQHEDLCRLHYCRREHTLLHNGFVLIYHTGVNNVNYSTNNVHDNSQ